MPHIALNLFENASGYFVWIRVLSEMAGFFLLLSQERLSTIFRRSDECVWKGLAGAMKFPFDLEIIRINCLNPESSFLTGMML